MASWILPTIECWGNFQYIKLPQRSFFGRIQDNIYFFRDFLTFTTVASNTLFKSPAPQVLENSGLQKAEIFDQSERFSLFAFVFALESFVLFLSLKQEMDNNF